MCKSNKKQDLPSGCPVFYLYYYYRQVVLYYINLFRTSLNNEF